MLNVLLADDEYLVRVMLKKSPRNWFNRQPRNDTLPVHLI